MKPLSIRFQSVIEDKISDISERTGVSKSDIARTAMYNGLRELSPMKTSQLKGTVGVAKLRIELESDGGDSFGDEVIAEIMKNIE